MLTGIHRIPKHGVHRKVHGEDQKFTFEGKGDAIMVKSHEKQSLGLENQHKCQMNKAAW